jgi:dipeptidyl-peptidase-4
MLTMLVCRNLPSRFLSRISVVALAFLIAYSKTTAQEARTLTTGKPPSSEIKSLQTVAERTNYLKTANEQDVLHFMQTIDDASPFASQFRIGATVEGRPIQALIIAKEPQPVLPLPTSDNRLVILLLGGIHSGECDGKEALLALARDLLADATPRYLDKAIMIFVPNFNADGNERVGILHRPGQEGPELGMGTRENAIGMDLNRDFIKLDTPEVRSLVRAIDRWDVDVLIDTHTTNGSLHQYDLTYDIPHNPFANQSIIQWMRNDMLPQITSEMASQGFPMFYYGNFTPDHKRWESFGHEPRYSTEYMGLRGKIGILVESYSYASYQRRIDATYLFVEACLRQLTENSERLNSMLQRSTLLPPKSVPVQAKIVASETPAIAKGYTWLNATNQSTKPTLELAAEHEDDHDHAPSVNRLGSPFPSPKDRKRKSEMTPSDFEVQLLNVGATLVSADAPEYYFVPLDNTWAVGRLRLHGIDIAPVNAMNASNTLVSGTLSASQYKIKARKELLEYQGHRLRKFEVALEPTEWRPSEGWLISTRQPLGQLATYLLEPHADDSLAVWNFFDPGLQAESIYPVVRIESQFASPAVLKPLGMFDPHNLDMALEPLTLAKIYDPQRQISLASAPASIPKWLPDGASYLIQHDGRWLSVDCKTGAMKPFDRLNRLVNSLSKLEAFKNGQANTFLRRIDVFESKFENALIEHKGDIYLFQTGGLAANGAANGTPYDIVRQITHSPEQSKELAELSPTGKHVAYIHDHNIWVADSGTTEVRQLTHDGCGEILNGKLDWVYQEEIYGRGQFKGFWWSPNGEWIAYLRLDETPVPRFKIDNSLTFSQTLEETRYPKSGQPNPFVSLHVVNVTSSKHQEIPLSEYPDDDRLVVRVGWHPSSAKNQVVFQVQNRIQSKLDVCAYDLNNKKLSKLVQEHSPAWVDVIEQPKWLPDESFLWLSDSAGGRRHLYRIGRDGSRTAITEGAWDVQSIERVSEDGKQVWLLGHHSSPINLDLLRADLSNHKLELVGEAAGVHKVSVNPTGEFYFDSWSDAKTPNQLWLKNAKGQKIRYAGAFQNDRFEYLRAGKKELFEIQARDGFAMQSLLYKPTDFAQRLQGKKMPVLIHVYGGPAAPTVANSWTHRNDLWHRYLAEQGICVLLCDNRSALGRGNSDTWKIYKDMGATELRDLEDAVQWLTQQSWVDSDRIGLWGWSYGGYFTAYAMTHSKLFRAGIAGAPVTDWQNYDSVYTERYMDTPKSNPDGYKSSSVVAAAKNLHGQLMLIHGEIDDNVHMANTMQLAHALQKANKDFELMVYPNNRHGVVDPDQSYHQYQLMTRFFEKRLLGD